MWAHLQREWFQRVNDLARHTGALHAPLRDYALYGVVLFAGILLAGWWLARRHFDEPGGPQRMAAALWAPVGTLIALWVNQPIGKAVHEARPYAVLPHVLVLVARSHDFSFPSDHAVMAGSVAAGAWLVDRRLGLFATLAALVMAFCRVYVGAHFPLDVVAGLAVGALVTGVGFLVLRAVLVRLSVALTRTPLRPLLAPRRPGAQAPAR